MKSPPTTPTTYPPNGDYRPTEASAKNATYTKDTSDIVVYIRRKASLRPLKNHYMVVRYASVVTSVNISNNRNCIGAMHRKMSIGNVADKRSLVGCITERYALDDDASPSSALGSSRNSND